MAILYDPEMEKMAREVAEKERIWQANELASKRAHELRLAKLKYSTYSRRQALTRAVVALAKAPAWLVLAVTIPKTVRADKEIPEFLQKFMIL